MKLIDAEDFRRELQRRTADAMRRKNLAIEKNDAERLIRADEEIAVTRETIFDVDDFSLDFVMVRCCDCYYAGPEWGDGFLCDSWGAPTKPDGFCSYGKPKEEQQDD